MRNALFLLMTAFKKEKKLPGAVGTYTNGMIPVRVVLPVAC